MKITSTGRRLLRFHVRFSYTTDGVLYTHGNYDLHVTTAHRKKVPYGDIERFVTERLRSSTVLKGKTVKAVEVEQVEMTDLGVCYDLKGF